MVFIFQDQKNPWPITMFRPSRIIYHAPKISIWKYCYLENRLLIERWLNKENNNSTNNMSICKNNTKHIYI